VQESGEERDAREGMRDSSTGLVLTKIDGGLHRLRRGIARRGGGFSSGEEERIERGDGGKERGIEGESLGEREKVGERHGSGRRFQRRKGRAVRGRRKT
jgi:hypothetical protein